SPLARPNAHRILQRQDEDLPVPDPAGVAGSGGVNDGLNRCLDERVVDGDFEFELGQQADLDFLPAVDLGVPLLPAAPADVRHGHQVDVNRVQGPLHVLELLRPDDRDDEFHESPCLGGGRFANAVSGRPNGPPATASAHPTHSSTRTLTGLPSFLVNSFWMFAARAFGSPPRSRNRFPWTVVTYG